MAQKHKELADLLRELQTLRERIKILLAKNDDLHERNIQLATGRWQKVKSGHTRTLQDDFDLLKEALRAVFVSLEMSVMDLEVYFDVYVKQSLKQSLKQSTTDDLAAKLSKMERTVRKGEAAIVLLDKIYSDLGF